MITMIYVRMCRNIDKHSSHDYHAKPFETDGRPPSDAMSRWFPSDARPLHDIQSQISLIRVRAVKLHEYMSRRRVTTNVRGS